MSNGILGKLCFGKVDSHFSSGMIVGVPEMVASLNKDS